MVRVCHIIAGDLWAGAEVMERLLLKNLLGFKDIELSVIIFNAGRLYDEIKKLSIPIELVDEGALSFPRMFLEIRKILKRTGAPDIIHSHRYKEHALACLFSRFCKRARLVATQHGMPETYGNTGLKRKLSARVNFFMLSRYFDALVAVSDEMRFELAAAYGFEEGRIRVIHNGTELPAAPGKKKRDRFTIGSAGRLVPVKDYPFMVEVAREVVKEAPGVRFELVGEGPEEGKIRRAIKRHGLEKNFFLRGFTEDVSAFYEGLYLYMNTSLHEGIPMSVLEAMSHGLPVIAPKVGGFKEIVEDTVEGYLIDDRDPRTFAEKCLALHRDKALRERVSASARDKAMLDFSAEAMARKYNSLYMELASWSRRHR